MKIKGAIIKEQGVRFAVCNVDYETLKSVKKQNTIKNEFAPLFGKIPVIFVSYNSKGIATFVGREDIVNFLSNVDSSQINWREFTSQ